MKIYIFYLSLFVITLALHSCSKQLEVSPPNNLTEEQIQEILASGDVAKIEQIIRGLSVNMDANFRLEGNYSGFSNNPLNPLINQELFGNLRGNDIVLGERTLGTSGDYQIFYSLDPGFQPWLAANRSYNYTWWLLAATPHTNANKVLVYLDREFVEKSGSKSLKDYRARCLSVRAFGYSLLMERFQKAYLHGGKEGKGMPIYSKYGINDPVAPSSAQATYDFIKEDLREAIKLFEESQIGEKDDGYTVATTNDVDRAVAQYLLARVSLWTGDYEACIISCEEILSHYPKFIPQSAYGVQTVYTPALAEGKEDVKADDNAFTSLKKNPEVILGWADNSAIPTHQYSNFNCFSEGRGGWSEYYMRIDDRLHNKIADDDFRKGLFLDNPITYVYPTNKRGKIIPPYTNLKWAATIALQQTVRNKEMNSDYICLRTSEVLLMLAEAQASSNKESDAKKTLNILLNARTKEGAPALTCDNYPSMVGLSVLDMVKLQWRIEMWGENGLEYANSKRWNTDIDRKGSTIHWSAGKRYSTEHMTYEIPIQETSTNGNWNN